MRPGFEGGQMPLFRHIPKRGFLPYGGKTEFAVVNVKDLSARFAAGSVAQRYQTRTLARIRGVGFVRPLHGPHQLRPRREGA